MMVDAETLIARQVEAARKAASDERARQNRWRTEVIVAVPASQLTALADTIEALVQDRHHYRNMRTP